MLDTAKKETASKATARPLTPPAVITPVGLPEDGHKRLVPLKNEFKAKVTALAESLEASLASDEVFSSEYPEKLAESFEFGIRAGAKVSRFVRRFVAQPSSGIETSQAYPALDSLRAQLTDLTSTNPDELLNQTLLLGLIPMGTKLEARLQNYQAASSTLKSCLDDLSDARRTLQANSAALDGEQNQLWLAMEKLEAALYFSATVEEKTRSRAEQLLLADPAQAYLFEQNVVRLVQRNLDSFTLHQVHGVNTYINMEALKKAYRELISGIERIEELGFKALNAVQIFAEGARGNLAENLRPGLQALRDEAALVLNAMRELDSYRFQVIGVLKHNNRLLLESFSSATSAVSARLDRCAQMPQTLAA